MTAVSSSPIIKLNATYIADQSKIWCIHSGKSRKVLERFIRLGIVALDLPGIRIDAKAFQDDITLSKHVLISEALQHYYKKVIDTPKTLPPPSRPSINPVDYSIPSGRSNLSRISYKLRSIRRFFGEIKKGDIVITPAQNAYEPFLFGFVTSDPAQFPTHTIPDYAQDPVPALNIDWVEHGITKRDIPSGLARLMERHEVITPIESAKFGPSLFTAVLGAYYGDQLFGVNIDCPNYLGKNPLETIPVQELIAAFTALIAAFDEVGGPGLQAIGFQELIDSYYDDGYVFALENEFHSPGFYRVICRNKTLGLLLLLMLPLISSTELDAVEIDKVKLEGATPQQQQDYSALIKPMLQHMTPDTRKQLVKRAEKAKAELNAHTKSEFK